MIFDYFLSKCLRVLKANVTEKNVNDVAGALVDIIQSSNNNSERVDIEAIQEIFVNIVNVGSSSLDVSFALRAHNWQKWKSTFLHASAIDL